MFRVREDGEGVVLEGVGYDACAGLEEGCSEGSYSGWMGGLVRREIYRRGAQI